MKRAECRKIGKSIKISEFSHSFIAVLVRNYILLTLILVVSAVMVFTLTSRAYNEQIQGLTGVSLANYAALLENENYSRFPIKRLLGRRGYIEVLDEQGVVVFTSAPEKSGKQYTAQETACMQTYQTDAYILVTPQQAADGRQLTMVACSVPNGNSYTMEDSIFIDGNNQIVYGTIEGVNGQPLSSQALGYLTQTLPDDYFLWKYPFFTRSKEARTLLLFEARMTTADYAQTDAIWDRAITAFLGFCVLIIAAFILWLNRKVQQPLALLNTALNNLAQGSRVEPLDYRGPLEFEQICGSFNRLSRRLVQSEQKRRQLEEDRQKMLADISHDLKTPITVIQGYARALNDGLVPPEKQRQILKTVVQKADGITELINTFHDYSKLDHPQFELDLAPQDVCELAREYLAEKYNEIELAGMTVDLDIPEQPALALINKQALRRCFDNLINNTLKHNGPGISLRFAIQLNGDQIAIQIGDTGKGIPPQLAGSLFDPFVTGDQARSQSGSGLGLAICKKIVEAHRGTILLVQPPRDPLSVDFEITLPLVQRHSGM